ncbi:MAG: hypothetical protein KGI69_02505 [Patescibacteria group bacterium]|nr:hypothetical protein [Patescibacteria group bacterium]
MKKIAPAGERGLVKLVVMIVIALLVLSYFGINLRRLVDSPTNQDNVAYIASSTAGVWNGYLKQPATFAWGIFVSYIWDPALQGLIDLKNHKQTPDFGSSTPALPSPQASQ